MKDGRETSRQGNKACAKLQRQQGVWVPKELEERQCSRGTRSEAGEGGTSHISQDFNAEHMGRGIMGDWKGKSKASLEHHS